MWVCIGVSAGAHVASWGGLALWWDTHSGFPKPGASRPPHCLAASLQPGSLSPGHGSLVSCLWCEWPHGAPLGCPVQPLGRVSGRYAL